MVVRIFRSDEGDNPMTLRIATLLVSLTLVMSAFAQPSKMDSEMAALRTYCKADVERLCPKVEPGGGRIKACLMEHKNEISVGCAKALQGLKKNHS
jgi:Cysteine rich repeat